jgi:hypothetical protein
MAHILDVVGTRQEQVLVHGTTQHRLTSGVQSQQARLSPKKDGMRRG